MVDYIDTSFLVSLYFRDAHSEVAQRLVRRRKTPFLYTSLQRHETRNAIRLAQFRGDITPEECDAVLSIVERDERVGVLAPASLPWEEVFEKAETMSRAHTGGTGTRAADILHVAAAVVLGAKVFYTFDERQKVLAARMRMKVKP